MRNHITLLVALSSVVRLEAQIDASLVDGRLALTGSGPHTYLAVSNWMEWPGGRPIGSTHGQVAVDSQGLVYIATDTDKSILVYKPNGEFLRSIAGDYSRMHDLVIRQEEEGEFLYCAHLGGAQAMKMDLNGDVIWKLGFPEEAGIYQNAGEYKPTGIAVAPNGEVYVADGYGKSVIHHYTADLKYKATYGRRGKGLGEFTTCHNIAVDTRGETPMLMVSDRDNSRMQYMTMSGEPVSIWGEFLRRPCAVSFWGEFVAVSEIQGRVTILNGKNEPVAFLGDNPDQSQWATNRVAPHDWRDGIFTSPHGCQFDKDGNIYVMDWNASGRVSKLERVEW